MMVPTGRLELPRIAPLAPQASVSTNSTTSALRKFSQGFWAGAGAGSAGAGTTGTAFGSIDGAAGAGTLVAGTRSSNEDGAARASR